MVKSHLPISSYARLNQLRRIKELYAGTVDKDVKGATELTPAQKVMAKQVLGSRSIDVLRYQALREMKASGYLDEEIKMVLADPDSPYSILIEGLKLENLSETIRAVLRKVKTDRKNGSETQARNEFIQQQRRLIEATWVTLSEAGAAHHKSLLEFIDGRSRLIAEAEGISFNRAGRSSIKTLPKKSSRNRRRNRLATKQKTPSGRRSTTPMRVTIQNNRANPVAYSITDRPVEVRTTSLGAAPDTIPAMSTMTLHLQENDVITLTAEGGIMVKKGEVSAL